MASSSSVYLPKFLATFSNLLHSSPKSENDLWVFWSQKDSTENPHDGIRRAFSSLQVYDILGFLQFWAPVETGGRRFLTTSNQPFSVSDLDKGLDKYRSCCEKYKYNVDVNYKSAPPATAFLNEMPELIPDLKDHRRHPVASCALKCGLMCYVALPIFDDMIDEGFCAGVVECCTTSYHELVNMLFDLSHILKKQGLRTFEARYILPYRHTGTVKLADDETIHGVKDAKDEIYKALRIVQPIFNLDLAQAWIAYKHPQTKRTVGLKLTDHFDDFLDDDDEVFEAYRNICYMLPLKMGEGLTGKTLENHQSHFMEVPKLREDGPLKLHGWRDLEAAPNHVSCFVICLRNCKMGDLEYVFEFLWHNGSNYVNLLESLLSSLKSHMPSFKYASGGELGDELSVIHVKDHTESEIGSFKIFQGKKSSLASKELEKKTTTISSSQEGMIETVKNPNVSLSTLKRKRKDKSDTNVEDEAVFQDMRLSENKVTVKAEYADDVIKFHLPISSVTFEAY